MLLGQLGNQTDIFWKFYLPADTPWLLKTVGQVLGYTTALTSKLDLSFSRQLILEIEHSNLRSKDFKFFHKSSGFPVFSVSLLLM